MTCLVCRRVISPHLANVTCLVYRCVISPPVGRCGLRSLHVRSFPFHLTNVLLHAIVACVVCRCVISPAPGHCAAIRTRLIYTCVIPLPPGQPCCCTRLWPAYSTGVLFPLPPGQCAAARACQLPSLQVCCFPLPLAIVHSNAIVTCLIFMWVVPHFVLPLLRCIIALVDLFSSCPC